MQLNKNETVQPGTMHVKGELSPNLELNSVGLCMLWRVLRTRLMSFNITLELYSLLGDAPGPFTCQHLLASVSLNQCTFFGIRGCLALSLACRTACGAAPTMQIKALPLCMHQSCKLLTPASVRASRAQQSAQRILHCPNAHSYTQKSLRVGLGGDIVFWTFPSFSSIA